MKVALCYHGIAKGYNFKNGGLSVGYSYEFDLIKKNLINQNPNSSFDIFLHSWSLDAKDEVIKKIKPKDYLFEQSRVFKKPTLFILLKENLKRIFGKGFETKRINNIYSRWYSFKKVCDLVKKSEETYDLVIVTRFDMCLLKPLDLSNVDPNYFYSGDWIGIYKDELEVLEQNYKDKSTFHKLKNKGYPYDNEGLQDFFFIASQTYMTNKFSFVYNQLKELIKKYGPSNHKIAFGKLKEDNMLDKHQRILTYSKDYFLSRWL